MLSLLLQACSPGADPAPTPLPAEGCLRTAVVTDIDETLTISDEEYLTQVLDASYDPVARPSAAELMSGYVDLGYAIVYLTARGEDLAPEGATARGLTVDWLMAHDFPVDEELVFLAEGVGALGDAAAGYKIEVLEGLVADGWRFPWGYGNADTDMVAFETVVPQGQLFLVGELAGEPGFEGYVPLPDEVAYAGHLEHLEQVAPCAEP